MRKWPGLFRFLGFDFNIVPVITKLLFISYVLGILFSHFVHFLLFISGTICRSLSNVQDQIKKITYQEN